MDTWVFLHTHTHTHTHTHVCACVCVCVCVCVCAQVCVCVHRCVCVCVCVPVLSVCMRMCECVHLCMCVWGLSGVYVMLLVCDYLRSFSSLAKPGCTRATDHFGWPEWVSVRDCQLWNNSYFKQPLGTNAKSQSDLGVVLCAHSALEEP